ncbi:MAG: hypothetical protein ACREAC_16210, partial [Blastocatellia bacterium]
MVARGGGTSSRESDGVRIRFPGSPDEFVAYAPADQQTWRTRLKWVEKQSAILLLNAPIVYAI